MKICIIAELAPAKTFIPIIKRLEEHEIIGLMHGKEVKNILELYCSSLYYIGKGRKITYKKNKLKSCYLIFKDIIRTTKVLRKIKPDLLLTCGNAGDVRKGIISANILHIPVLHIEQDIYNPIEMIAFADIITAPSKDYKEYLEREYLLKNVRNIGGYPHALYVLESEIKTCEEDDFILLVLGGDIKYHDVPKLIKTIESLDEKVLIVPFRFKTSYIKSLITSSKVKVLEGFVDLLSYIKNANAVIYCAGMGVTIEVAVLEIPSIKVAGFHYKHASVDLAKEVGIPIVKIQDIPKYLPNLKKPKAKSLIEGSKKSVNNVVKIIENFSFEKKEKSGFKSLKKIWDARSKFM